MKKFIDDVCLIAWRIVMFVVLLAMSPLWIFIGIAAAFSSLFGSFDDVLDGDVYVDDKSNSDN